MSVGPPYNGHFVRQYNHDVASWLLVWRGCLDHRHTSQVIKWVTGHVCVMSTRRAMSHRPQTSVRHWQIRHWTDCKAAWKWHGNRQSIGPPTDMTDSGMFWILNVTIPCTFTGMPVMHRLRCTAYGFWCFGCLFFNPSRFWAFQLFARGRRCYAARATR